MLDLLQHLIPDLAHMVSTKPVFIHLPAVTHPQFDSFDVHLDRLLTRKADASRMPL
ncbi:hypothetical protein HCG45_02120 [Pseudomonas fulva]|uniref:hypothetical protein n=1 Tax=Pseudomonas fulva TaxID=47880 RepID=UPI001428A0BF|nr:hypothetical protein [Pseudomonas fulva]NIX91551.1 hypothetical protein [Pseudomonas fulva]